MKKFLQILTASVFVGGACSSYAGYYYDLDYIKSTVAAGGNTVNGMFNISDATGDDGFNKVGYDPSVEHVTSAIASFVFHDDEWFESEPEMFEINLGSEQFLTGTPILFHLGSVTGSLLVDLSATGQLSYNILATKGDFTVQTAKVLAFTAPGAAVIPNSAPVPDGGVTLALLGLSAVGLGWLRRR